MLKDVNYRCCTGDEDNTLVQQSEEIIVWRTTTIDQEKGCWQCLAKEFKASQRYKGFECCGVVKRKAKACGCGCLEYEVA